MKTGDSVEFKRSSTWYQCGARLGTIAKQAKGKVFIAVTDCQPSWEQGIVVLARPDDFTIIHRVWRYVITYVNRQGQREIFGPAQGRNTFEAISEAEARLDAIKSVNTTSTLASVVGGIDAIATMEVREVECWPNHFDPKGRYFDV